MNINFGISSKFLINKKYQKENTKPKRVCFQTFHYVIIRKISSSKKKKRLNRRLIKRIHNYSIYIPFSV